MSSDSPPSPPPPPSAEAATSHSATANWVAKHGNSALADELYSDTNFIEILYKSCLGLFAELWKYAHKSSCSLTESQKASLQRDLGSLALFGDGFENGKLDSFLALSDDLRENALEILSGIGDLLLQSE